MSRKTVLTWYKAENVLPVSADKVLCLTRTKKGVLNMVLGYYADGRWCCGMNSNVIAWAPLVPVYADLFDWIHDKEARRRKCRDCEFYGIRAGETEPHCMINDRMTSDWDLPCVLEEEEED